MNDVIKMLQGDLIVAFENGVLKAVQNLDIEIDRDKLLEVIELSERIVRCKDCKHSPWNYSDEGPLDYTCIWDDDFADRPQRPDDFCSYGERKEGE